MTGFQINYDLSGLKRIADRLHEAGKKSPVILKAAVKHTGDKATSAMRSALVGQTGLKRKTLVKAVKGRSTGSGYEIKSHGGNIRLKFFNARETSKGVTAAPWNARRLYPGTFIKSGWWPKRVKAIAGGQVLQRAGAGKYPIHGVKSGLFIAEEMVKGSSEAAFYSTIDSDLAPRIEHELARILG
jgi:hypothetical protein